jgi:flagellar secretion chaperone FliS
MNTNNPLAARSYQNLAIETSIADADPHRLISLLYAGALESIARARGALNNQDTVGRGKAVNRAIRIIDEGLRHALDLNSYALAQDLDRLYDYMIRRLFSAHRHASDTMLKEVASLLGGLNDAWLAIAPSKLAAAPALR